MTSAPLAKAKATATKRSGGLQYAPMTPPITKALDATRPKRSAFNTGASPAHPRTVWIFASAIYLLYNSVRGHPRAPRTLELLFETYLSFGLQALTHPLNAFRYAVYTSEEFGLQERWGLESPPP